MAAPQKKDVSVLYTEITNFLLVTSMKFLLDTENLEASMTTICEYQANCDEFA